MSRCGIKLGDTSELDEAYSTGGAGLSGCLLQSEANPFYGEHFAYSIQTHDMLLQTAQRIRKLPSKITVQDNMTVVLSGGRPVRQLGAFVLRSQEHQKMLQTIRPYSAPP